MSAPFTVGDRGTVIAGKCSDGDQPIDLAGATVELHLGPVYGPVRTKLAAVTDPAAGQWAYTWTADDLDQSGQWLIEAQVTSGDGQVVQTFGPQRFDVQQQIA